jgi:hypothetical protein
MHNGDAVCFIDFYQDSEMIIFKSILSTFVVDCNFKGRWGSSKNWLELKIEPR